MTPSIESTEQCCERVHEQGRGVGFQPCQIKASVTRDGKRYCRVHDPEAQKRRDARASEKYQAEREKIVLGWKAAESYRKHFGPNAVSAAEGDALGDALKAIELLLPAAKERCGILGPMSDHRDTVTGCQLATKLLARVTKG